MLNIGIEDSRTSGVAPFFLSIEAFVDGFGCRHKGEKGSGLDIPLNVIETAGAQR